MNNESYILVNQAFTIVSFEKEYRQVPDIRRTSVGNNIVGAAPTISSFST